MRRMLFLTCMLQSNLSAVLRSAVARTTSSRMHNLLLEGRSGSTCCP